MSFTVWMGLNITVSFKRKCRLQNAGDILAIRVMFKDGFMFFWVALSFVDEIWCNI